MIKKIVLGLLCVLGGIISLLSPIGYRLFHGHWFISPFLIIPLMVISFLNYGYLFWLATIRKPKPSKNMVVVFKDQTNE